ESARALDELPDEAAAHQEGTGVRLLWGTANLFSHPRYQAGAATNPDPDVFAWAAGQVSHCLEVTHRLGGANYVLWGGREGYDTILNTDLRREREQLARFLHLVVEHKHAIGFEGAILLEPKPFEPAKYQYDRDVATVFAFLQRHGLETEIKVNIEVNHATLAGLDFAHEVAVAVDAGIFGSIDANAGDDRLGWDVDRFPVSVEQMTLGMYEVLRGGGFQNGGLNFDAKLRRQSTDQADLFHAHIGGMDTMARALLAASAMLEDGSLESARSALYAGWDAEHGRSILAGNVSLAALRDRVPEVGEPVRRSGRQEELENLVARFVERAR
ncbi:MAG: xylose isomerase, partial [Actinomycetota bacterium]|nr:xylose isomerase [Actinomycetota bacterium]